MQSNDVAFFTVVMGVKKALTWLKWCSLLIVGTWVAALSYKDMILISISASKRKY